jgi:hypothetical protein
MTDELQRELALQQYCLEKALETKAVHTGDHIAVLEAANAYLRWLKA